MDKPETASEKTKQRYRSHLVTEWTIAGIGGLLTGITGLVARVNQEFHENISASNVFKFGSLKKDELGVVVPDSIAVELNGLKATGKLRGLEEHERRLDQHLIDQLKRNGCDDIFKTTFEEIEKKPVPDAKPFIKAYSETKNWNITLRKQIVEKGLGIHSHGWEGLTVGNWQKFNTLTDPSKNAVLRSAGIATLIGAASVIMFTNNMRSRNNQVDIKEQLSNMHDEIVAAKKEVLSATSDSAANDNTAHASRLTQHQKQKNAELLGKINEKLYSQEQSNAI